MELHSFLTRKIGLCLPKNSETLETSKNQDQVVAISDPFKVQNVLSLVWIAVPDIFMSRCLCTQSILDLISVSVV